MAGWGGRRAGAGAKPKSMRERAVSGVPAHKPRTASVLAHPSVPKAESAAEVATFDPPKDLSDHEREVWTDLAQHAAANRTLVPSTRWAFRILCANIVLERSMRRTPDVCGGGNHRGIIQRIDAELLAFNLAPCGKAMFEGAGEPKKPANPLERYLSRSRG